VSKEYGQVGQVHTAIVIEVGVGAVAGITLTATVGAEQFSQVIQVHVAVAVQVAVQQHAGRPRRRPGTGTFFPRARVGAYFNPTLFPRPAAPGRGNKTGLKRGRSPGEKKKVAVGGQTLPRIEQAPQKGLARLGQL
jgi:hypothetical protein